MDDASKGTFGVSTALASSSVLLAIAAYAMAYLPWRFDTAAFEGPAVLCVVLGALSALLTVPLAIRRVEFVPRWLWQTEIAAAAVSILVLLNLLRLW